MILFFSQVTAYDFIKNNVNITVLDTPGLADTTSSDEEYLQKIKEKGNDFDLLLFCIEMNNTRFRNDDFETMKKLTSTLGVQLWDHAVVVLTFANMVLVPPREKAKGVSEKDVFNDHFLRLKSKLQQALTQIGVPEEAAIKVPFVPAGDSSEPKLADRDDWLTAFWVEAFKRINKDAKAAFFLSNADRIKFSSVLDTDEESQESAAIRALEDSFEGVAFETNMGTSRSNVEGGQQSIHPPQNQVVRRSFSPSIQLDESSSRNIVNHMVGEVTGVSIEASTGPVFVRFYQTFLSLVIKFFRLLFRNSPETEAPEKDESRKGKGKAKQKDNVRNYNVKTASSVSLN